MNEEILNKILNVICRASGSVEEGGYIIIGGYEFLEKVPEAQDARTVDRAIVQLEASDLVDVKYKNRDTYCLAVTTRGVGINRKWRDDEEKRKLEEQKQEEKKAELAASAQEVPAQSAPVAAPVQPLPSVDPAPTEIGTPVVKIPWGKILGVCAAFSLLGGAIAGVIVSLLARMS